MTFTRIAATATAFAALVTSGAALADHLNVPVDMVKTDGMTVTFPSVLIDKDGFVVIHAIENGAPVLPGNVGSTAVKAGTTENVAVTVEGLEAGKPYLVMLHYDTDADGVYGFGEASTEVDTPALNAEGKPYMKEFTPAM